VSEHDELSRKLLEENGLREGAVREADREGLRAIVEAERKRDSRLRSRMLGSWLVFVVLFAGSIALLIGVRALGQGHGMGIAVVPLLTLTGLPLAGIAFIFALVTTVAWGLRLAIGPRGVEERLERIEAQLARIEAAQGEAERPIDAKS
jgi:hypothetical protein